MTRKDRDSADALPENHVYRDTGCGYGCVRSLECPFPVCRYDDPDFWRREENLRLAREIKAARAAGRMVREVAAELGISRRTVHRILEKEAEAGWMVAKSGSSPLMPDHHASPKWKVAKLGVARCTSRTAR